MGNIGSGKHAREQASPCDITGAIVATEIALTRVLRDVAANKPLGIEACHEKMPELMHSIAYLNLAIEKLLSFLKQSHADNHIAELKHSQTALSSAGKSLKAHEDATLANVILACSTVRSRLEKIS